MNCTGSSSIFGSYVVLVSGCVCSVWAPNHFEQIYIWKMLFSLKEKKTSVFYFIFFLNTKNTDFESVSMAHSTFTQENLPLDVFLNSPKWKISSSDKGSHSKDRKLCSTSRTCLTRPMNSTGKLGDIRECEQWTLFHIQRKHSVHPVEQNTFSFESFFHLSIH